MGCASPPLVTPLTGISQLRSYAVSFGSGSFKTLTCIAVPDSEISTVKKSALIVLSLFCLVLIVSNAVAGTMPKFAERQTVTFNKPMVLGTTELPAGNYSITHEMQGDDHYMTFKQTDVRKDKAATVRVKCNLVPLPEKAKRTEQRYISNAKSQNVLSELVFKGDEAKHVFETPAL